MALEFIKIDEAIVSEHFDEFLDFNLNLREPRFSKYDLDKEKDYLFGYLKGKNPQKKARLIVITEDFRDKCESKEEFEKLHQEFEKYLENFVNKTFVLEEIRHRATSYHWENYLYNMEGKKIPLTFGLNPEIKIKGYDFRRSIKYYDPEKFKTRHWIDLKL